ncbi:leucine-rich repeat domain-containing protein [Pseudomonas entomophila]|uniref:leucine-rich repeat domain-containing protein n=1 Tax=Pseudomonas entomophila TaxID=312306 RepID=UPI0015E41C26|nr:leucine-rich repeat domain-containing protein [Pseudomonas entomophila]MBA1189256.1 leucine-rich repeat domain-containing protein [Pseudomonas entomophila]
MPSLDTNPHHDLIRQRLPAWSRYAGLEQWRAVLDSHTPTQGLPGQEAAWFANAAPDLREAVEASQAALRHAEQTLARSLKGLQQIEAFAEPLLRERLAHDHGLTGPLDDYQLLHVQRTWHWQGARYLNRHERQGLLQAALQNFADDVVFEAPSALARRDAIEVTPITVHASVFVSPDLPGASLALPSERYQVTPLPLTAAAFAETCRQLDLGARYQAHLREVFEPAEGAARLRTQSLALHRARLQVANDLAYLRHHLSGAAHDEIAGWLAGETASAWSLNLFGIPVHEALLLHTDAAGLVLYLPGNPVALRWVGDAARLGDVLDTVLSDAAQCAAFMAYVPHARQAEFTRILAQNLGKGLPVQRLPLEGNPFDWLHDDHLRRVYEEARAIAVPTADADDAARRRRLAALEERGLDLLTLAGFFIPAVGTCLVAITAWQLLDEVYEGYEAWRVGDRDLALRHCQAVGLNLLLIAGVHAAGTALPALFNSPLMESLDEVRRADGSLRLRQPNLDGYASDAVLPETLQPDAQGHYRQGARVFVRLEGQVYEQAWDARLGQWRVLKPGTPEAYRPVMHHDGQGAWWVEHERPSTWSPLRLVQRLGPSRATLDKAELHLASQCTGVDPARLRQVYLRGEPAPALFLDTLARLAAERQAQARLAVTPHAPWSTLFDEAYLPPSPADAAETRLCQAYPRLSRPLARRLLKRLSEAERTAWREEGLAPAFFLDAAREVDQALPLTRALEGLYRPRLASPFSEQLILAGLERSPRWPEHLRLELRDASPEGPTVFSAGHLQATDLRVVLRLPGGYEPWLGERPAPGPLHADLCQAVLEALTPAQRQALGWHDAGALRADIGQQAVASRETLSRRLSRPSGERPRVRGPLRGGAPTDYPMAAPLRRSLRERYRRLYPCDSDHAFERQLRDWNRTLRTPEVELRHLEARLEALRADLTQWAGDLPRRQRARRALINAWRRDLDTHQADGQSMVSLNLAGLELEDVDLASLSLPDDFAHVRQLDLSRNRALTRVPDTLLARFPQLYALRLEGCRLDHLPQVTAPDRLAWLDVPGNRITWSAETQARLDTYPHLRLVDLSDNPLIEAPNVSHHPLLHSLYLVNCSLTQLPEGLDRLQEPLILDLSENQFTHLPDDLDLPDDAGRALRLESEWLSSRVQAQIGDYHARTGVDLLVADAEYEDLLAGISPGDWQIWADLPLAYRRELRGLTEHAFFLQHPEQASAELWRRLRRLQADPALRAEVLARPADLLMQWPI